MTRKAEAVEPVTLEQLANQAGVSAAWLAGVLRAVGTLDKPRAAALASLVKHAHQLDVAGFTSTLPRPRVSAITPEEA